MNRLDAVKIIIGSIPEDALVVCANGAISREAHFCADRTRNFYLLGTMGLAASVAFGVALHARENKVIVLDGDGNILMGFGNLALIGAYQPENLIHFVLDNQVYGTTGNQPTISPNVPLAEVARSAGYKHSHRIEDPDSLASYMKKDFPGPGPHFVHIVVDSSISLAAPRIPYSAEEMKFRFRGSMIK